ncbi:sulfite exporter TauE/SafE family protein, partial [Achromobacter aegrifaciens]|uniref:sulfite exporter TauE/SafE family protein n=1 Tax=Achromobacter aegrifaciens TaxID=1287736 RepID=UPI0028A980AC
MIDTVLAASVALGACVGLILGLTGAGGAIMAVPLLVFGLHLQVSQAAPIALLAVGLSAALGAVLGLRKGQVRYRAAGFMAATGILVSPLGLWAARRLPNAPLAIIFAGVLGMVAWRMWNQGNKPAAAQA